MTEGAPDGREESHGIAAAPLQASCPSAGSHELDVKVPLDRHQGSTMHDWDHSCSGVAIARTIVDILRPRLLAEIVGAMSGQRFCPRSTEQRDAARAR